MRDYTFDKMPISSISGKMYRGSDVYYRTINGKTYAYLVWNPNTKPPTPGTVRTRDTFRLASLYTSLDMRLPFKLAEWKLRMLEHNRLAIAANPDFARHPENYNKHNDPKHLRPYTSVRYFILATYAKALASLSENRPHLTLNTQNTHTKTPQFTPEILTLFIRLNLFSRRKAFDNQPPLFLPLDTT